MVAKFAFGIGAQVVCRDGSCGKLLKNGVLRLMGVVPDVQVKRHAEAIARSLQGVIQVENF